MSLLAFFFGAGNAMDAFNVAFRIPNLLRDLFAEGAMSAAFVPTFTRRLTTRGRDEAWRLGNYVVTALVLVTSVLVIFGVVFASPLVRLLAGDYAQVPGKFELTVSMTRIMMPFLTLIAVAAACMGMLNSLRRFFIPAFAPAMFNVGTIAGVLILVPVLAQLGVEPIYAVALATLVGGVLQVAVQWPALGREGYRYRASLDPRDPGLREILVLMGPGMLGLAAVQINVFVNTWLATSQGTGAVSWLNYAFRLMYMPIGIFGLSIATAALPAMSQHAAREDLAGMRQTFSSGLRMMFMLNVPATAGLIALASPIVDLLFRYGRFSASDTGSDGRGRGRLCSRAGGILGREDRGPDLLHPPRQPHAGHRVGLHGDDQRRPEPAAGSCDGLPGAGARDCSGGAVQRGRCCCGCSGGGWRAWTGGGWRRPSSRSPRRPS